MAVKDFDKLPFFLKWPINPNKMDPSLKKALEIEDLDKAMLETAHFAGTILRKYFWRGFRSSGNQADFDVHADSHSAEDFASEALARLLSGQRSYNPKKSLVENLKSVAESIISSAKKSSDRKPLNEYLDQPEAEGNEPQDPISTAVSQESQGHGKIITDEIKSDLKKVDESLLASLDGDEESQDYLRAMAEGFHSPQDIADVTGIDVKRIYELRREIKSRAKVLFGVQNYVELKRIVVKGT